MDIPDGVDATRVPSPQRLSELSQDELFAIIDWWQTQNYVGVGPQFWIDELSRRRTEALLGRMVDVSAEIAALTRDAAAENTRTAELNKEMRDLTRTTMRLTMLGVAVAIVAAVASIVALI